MKSKHSSLAMYCILHDVTSLRTLFYTADTSGRFLFRNLPFRLSSSAMTYRSLLLLLSRAGHTAERFSFTGNFSSQDEHVREQDVQR